VSEQWKSKVGSEASVEWPVGVGAKGNKGVASEVADTEGSIGYVDYAYAKQQKLTYANMINKDGKTVAPELKSFQAAAANADWKATPGFGVILTDQPGDALLADHGGDLHPDAQGACGPGCLQRSARLLRLGLPEGRRDGRGARLHSLARQRRRPRA